MLPQDLPPKLPALKAEPAEGKRGKPLFPSLKVRGGNPNGIVPRLKSLSRKDLIFILAGLSVLCMVPAVERVLLAPGEDFRALEPGFDRKGPLFSGDANVYESGTGALSPGGLIGEGTDVITPLNVRDPSALILGPGAVRKSEGIAPAGDDWKSALTQAASRAARAASGKASLPAPRSRMARALRGLSVLSGSNAQANAAPRLEPLSAARVPNRTKESGSLAPVRAVPGFQGAALRGLASGGEPESLKAGGNRQAEIFNKGNSAVAALDTAARQSVPGGSGASGGEPGEGSEGKGPSLSSTKDSKALGESLAALRAKLEMEKELDLKWKKKNWYDFELQKMIQETLIKSALESIVGKGLLEPIGKAIADALGRFFSGGPQGMSCLCVEPGKCGSARFSMPMAQFSEAKSKEPPGWPESEGYSCMAWSGDAKASVPADGGSVDAGRAQAPPADVPQPESEDGP